MTKNKFKNNDSVEITAQGVFIGGKSLQELVELHTQTKLRLIEGLYKLDGLSKDNDKSLVEIALKLSEESGEVAEAVLGVSKASGSGYKDNGLENVLEESVDALMVAYSLFIKAGGTKSELADILEEKLGKWERTTSKEEDISIELEAKILNSMITADLLLDPITNSILDVYSVLMDSYKESVSPEIWDTFIRNHVK